MIRKLRYMAFGAMLAYFFDPQNGRARRSRVLGRIPSFRSAAQVSVGVDETPRPDDATLALKVQTEIFRDSDIPKGRINVDAEKGKVVLRGEVEQPELIKDLEKRTKNVQGVEEVENLLHVPGTPAPTT
jgi:osmotically-inducible protein OsmY